MKFTNLMKSDCKLNIVNNYTKDNIFKYRTDFKKMARRTREKMFEEGFIRILDTDIPSEKNVYVGLTKIKGISFTLSNAICNYLGINKFKKLKDVSDTELKKLNEITSIINCLPGWLFNRRRDRESGKDLHLFGTKLDLTKEFDIRRLKKIKAYRGVRHAFGLPVRGQRTKSHFRKGIAVGVQKAKSKKR